MADQQIFFCAAKLRGGIQKTGELWRAVDNKLQFWLTV